MKLMEQVCQVLRVRHYSLATERCYCQWIRRFIFFHGVKHPNSMGAEEVERFLTHLATAEKVAASTQNQALNALVFLRRRGLGSFRVLLRRSIEKRILNDPFLLLKDAGCVLPPLSFLLFEALPFTA